MAKSTTMRKLVAGLGTILVIAVSLPTTSTLPLDNLSKTVTSVLGAILLYTSVALASAIHRSYPEKHDEPKDMGQLLVEGPYELCRHPFYFLTMLAQVAIPLTLTSLTGLLVALALTPAWLLLVRLEEKELIEYWGEEYIKYMEKVPALIPDLKKIIWKHRK